MGTCCSESWFAFVFIKFFFISPSSPIVDLRPKVHHQEQSSHRSSKWLCSRQPWDPTTRHHHVALLTCPVSGLGAQSHDRWLYWKENGENVCSGPQTLGSANSSNSCRGWKYKCVPASLGRVSGHTGHHVTCGSTMRRRTRQIQMPGPWWLPWTHFLYCEHWDMS